MRILIYYLIVINIIAWIAYGLDKWKACAGKWRIPEKTLLAVAAAGGSAGALAAMLIFRHKIRKPKFYISVPAFLIIHCILIYAAVERFI